MTTNAQDQALNLAAANKTAQRNFSREELTSPVAACPARQAEVFIVPTRYALGEQPAAHACVQPGTTSQSHPMALRRLRPGFLYLWHHEGPLRRYAVASDGLLTEQALDDDDTLPLRGQSAGIALDKRHDAWLLYSEIPLPAQACQRLAENPGEHMRQIALRQVARTLETPHCPPLDDAERLLAELMPEVREKALAHDHARNGDAHRQGVDALGQRMMADPSPENVQAYVDARTWQAEREQAAARHPEAAQQGLGEWSAVAWDVPAIDAWLARARSEAGALHAVFATLDDDLGVLRDLNHEQERLEAGHESWIADNNLRQSVGGFIRSLIREDGGEVANLLNYRYREHDIQLTPDQGETLLASQRRLAELFREESRISQERGRQYGHAQADAELAGVHAEVAAATVPVRGFIPPELHGEVEHVVREYRKEKVSNLADGRAAARVAEHIDLERLDAWLDQEAPAHYRQVEERHQALYADRGQFLPRHSSGTWFVDHADPAHQRWLDELAEACLSAQCSRQQGAEQFAGYVRSDDPGSLRLVFHAWSPSLEAAVNVSARLNEILAALSADNLAATQELLASQLDEPGIRALQRLAQDLDGIWASTVARLGASLVVLKTQGSIAAQWAGVLLVTRLGEDARLLRVAEGAGQGWRLLGNKADALNRWLQDAVRGIAQGRVASVAQSSAVRNSGGLLPLAALLLNGLNASDYLRQAGAVEGMDSRRLAETVSASLYAGAALTAVVQNWLILGKGIEELNLRTSIAPTLTLFGGIVGLLSVGAAYAEYASLRNQIEHAQTRIDPWLERRQLIVQGQVAAYGAQALLGFGLTGMRMANHISTAQALRYFRLGMGPLNLLLLGLGGAYLHAWSRQATPMQNYLAGCCWSKGRAWRAEAIPAEQQQDEFRHLLALLYQPRIQLETGKTSLVGSRAFIRRLSIDLPGAEPGATRLDLALLGNPGNLDALRESANPFGHDRLSDLGAPWLRGSQCTWIPPREGQGLRLAGDFKLGRPYTGEPTRLLLRLRYHNPLALLAEVDGAIGGERGLAYSLDADQGIIPLRDGEATPELDRATLYPLGEEPNALFLQPKEAK
ncbi:toxin VasX [Pseudomonas lopnurensis]|uniref:toxin VasX n=1 Tax=Pseudomonas lopnurensis TaxID=1477517 RepID=UPI00187A38D5|nr:toxin VasX [Pseudomonas lopnurensis]MBE7375827.1 hypothetical protein [Pseudomonas lopnurensis]